MRFHKDTSDHSFQPSPKMSSIALFPPTIFLLLAMTLVTFFHVTTTLETPTVTLASLKGNETDHRALLAFKTKILHDPQGVTTSWNDSTQFCNWQGVTCGRRHRTRVTILDLRSRGLVGFISPHVGNLSFLRSLILWNNTFQGKIPREVGNLFRLQLLGLQNNSLEGRIPADLSRCSSLTGLALSHNKLVGNIPRDLIFSLSKLVILQIHLNNLEGPIPPFIGNLTSLEVISAAGNAFTGTIPEALGTLKRLTFLGFDSNNLFGMIPASIYNNLSSITFFSFAQNQLSGSLPANLGSLLPHLERLELWGNQFTGTLPTSLSNTSDMQYIDMSVNNFHGKISIDFSRLGRLTYLSLLSNYLGSGESGEMDFLTSLANNTNLEKISLGDNRLNGTLLPNHLANFSTQLSLLELGLNQIYGEIPSTITNLVGLTWLALYQNKFTGTIPLNIGYLHNLNILYLDYNILEGNLPHSIGNLTSLIQLYLDDNSLQGQIPPSIESCQNLLLLSLPQNNFSGPIPEQLFSNLSLLISLNLSGNHFSGLLPPEIANLKALGKLDVSNNDLSGELPSSLGSCSSLETLYLQSNSFQGSIPSSLEGLRGIVKLDFSRNNLSGQIPKYLENFALLILNLSFNNFEGEVPMEGVFSNVSAVSVVGNDRLCGGIYGLHLPRCTLKGSKKRRHRVFLAVVLTVSAASILVAITITLLKFCWFKKEIKDPSSGSLFRKTFNRVSYRKLLEATEGFSSGHLIGKGSFGSVYRAILDDTTVAVKVFDLQHRGGFKSFKVECEALRNIRHRNLLQILTSCSSVDFRGNDFRALVYEFMPRGSLERWLHLHMSTVQDGTGPDGFPGLNLSQRINIATDVACALEYLHHHCPTTIIHCDLKPSNVLLDNDMVAHVGDFGLARFLQKIPSPNQSSSIGIRGTLGYAPPEYGIGNEVSTSGDVYSYGILLLEMMTGKRPTDPMFGEGLNLHNYARRAMDSQVMDIVEPKILPKESEEDVVSLTTNNRRKSTEVRNENLKERCFITIVKIGVACSMESPEDRMDISSVVKELNSVKIILQGSQNGP